MLREVELFGCFLLLVLHVQDSSAKIENVNKESVASQHTVRMPGL